MESKLLKRRLPWWVILAWGGFNAGALLGLADSLAIMILGLASFDRGGSFVGLIVLDALGCGVIGIISVFVSAGSLRLLKISHVRTQTVFSGILMLLICGYLTVWNLGWSMRSVTGKAPPDSPNVLLLTLDTLRADSLGCGGNPAVRSPMLDRLAIRGVQWSNAVCSVPMTTPSHASILTSTIPAVHGAIENKYRLHSANVTMPELFRKNGYRTAAFVSCFPLDRRFGLDQGFMLYHDQFGIPGDLRQASWLNRILTFSNRHKMERIARHTNSLAVPWIRRYARENPFFLWIHYFDPHAPYAPPSLERSFYLERVVEGRSYKSDEEKERARAVLPPGMRDAPQPGQPEALYLGEISEMDRAIERVFRELALRRVLDHTIVWIAADHGESFGEHGLFYTHGEDIYEPALNVPLVGYNIGQTAKIRTEPASLIDLAPTILKRAGIAIPDSMEGLDLFGTDLRMLSLVENFGLIMAHNAVKQRGIRTADTKFILAVESQACELYDLTDDPSESRNIADIDPSKAEQLTRQVIDEFTTASQRGFQSIPDQSSETLERLKSLGYFQ